MTRTTEPPRDVIQPTDDEARALARRLIDTARFAALAVIADGTPAVSRIAIGTTPEGLPLTLVSGLAGHTRALRDDARAALLIGEPADKGDPLTHPRLSLGVAARFVDRPSEEHDRLRAHWLAGHPKSTLYVDLPDFRFVVFTPTGASLNGGFARAFRLTGADLTP